MTDFISYLNSGVYSDMGLVRSNNEDNYLLLPEDGIFAVMDGMGGGDAGEVASLLIRDCLAQAATNSRSESPGERKYAVQQALHKAHSAILDYTAQNNYKAVGSTFVGILFDPWDPETAYVCHIGDSRLYCLRNGELFQITVDHTVGNEMLHKKQSTAGVNPKLLHVLTRVVGVKPTISPQWTQISVCSGDRYLLCSDGVWGLVSDDKLAEFLSAGKDIPSTLTNIRKQVLLNGANDNFTAVIIDVSDNQLTTFTPDPIDKEESDLLLKVAEERIDYGRK